MSTLLWTLDPKKDNISGITAVADPAKAAKLLEYFPSWDHGRLQGSPHRIAATNIYKTKDDRFFHIHGSMNPDPTLESLGLPKDLDAPSIEAACAPFIEKIAQIDSEDMQRLESEKFRQAGTICWTTEEYKNSEHGEANANAGLFEIREHPSESQQPGWWPESPQTSSQRPLAGLKVVDITRVIAGPAITRGLAELGASVMRVIAPHLIDYSTLHCDLNWGKWNSCLDLRKEEDSAKLRELISEADVVVTGYRPNVLDKWGFGEQDILNLVKERSRGIIYARENCYGWHGPWSYRSGWQQISDAVSISVVAEFSELTYMQNTGVSYEFGRANGHDEPVTPVYPNSDYWYVSSKEPRKFITIDS